MCFGKRFRPAPLSLLMPPGRARREHLAASLVPAPISPTSPTPFEFSFLLFPLSQDSLFSLLSQLRATSGQHRGLCPSDSTLVPREIGLPPSPPRDPRGALCKALGHLGTLPPFEHMAAPKPLPRMVEKEMCPPCWELHSIHPFASWPLSF